MNNQKNLDGVSVIMPIYNRANSCLKSIKSVLDQSYDLLELIIVDDFSDDFELLRKNLNKLNDPRIRVIRCGVKSNGAKARNVGVSSARFSVVAFLDSDDFWVPDKLAEQMSFYRRGCVLACLSNVVVEGKSKITIVGPPSNIVSENIVQPVLEPIHFLFGNLTHNITFQTSTLLLDKELFVLSGGFDETLGRHQDYQLIMSLKKSGAKFFYVNKVLSNYYKSCDVFDVKSEWSLDKSIVFLNKYSKFLDPILLSNFIVTQLFSPSLKSGKIVNLFQFCLKKNISIYSVIFKYLVFVCNRIRYGR